MHTVSMGDTMDHADTTGKHAHEKRRSPRMALENVTVEVYTTEGQTVAPQVCDIVNLSEGGMLFRCDHRYRMGQLLRLTFLIPDSLMAVRTDAVVVHERIDMSGKYAGARFAKLGVAEHASLQQFVRTQQSN
jgi:hypothetical protein